MNWKGQLNKQEESKPQFVDPQNQEDEEMEKVEKFLGRFKKPQPLPIERWNQVLNEMSGSLKNLVGFLLAIDSKEGSDVDLLWDQKKQGSFTLQEQVAALKKYGNTADEIVNLMSQRIETGDANNLEARVEGFARVFSSTLGIRDKAIPLIRQIAQQKDQQQQTQGGQ
tara:strand:+ start:82 stop:585 length:504 start_codon:yes stop_codon:yes gene_type:complete